MIVLAFFSWWYGRGWREEVHSLAARVRKVNRSFSVQLLLKTLFSPWRRIMTYPGASLADHFRAWGDNVVSRAVGFFVRLIVLLSAGVAIGLVGLLSVAELVLWPLLPPAIIACLVMGVLVR